MEQYGSSFYYHEHDDFSTARIDRFRRAGRGTDRSGDGKSECIELCVQKTREKFQQ